MNDFNQITFGKIAVILLIVFFGGNSLGLAQGSNKTIDEIRKCFSGYKQSIMDQNGVEAIEFIDLNILEYYGNMLDKIKFANQAEIDSMSMFDKLMIITVRHNSTTEDLNAFTPKKPVY